MGLANLVPGISGGTMLLAAGVYPQFIEGIAEVTTLRFRARNLALLGAIGGAAAIGIVSLAGLIKGLVIDHRWAMFSLFIGLTLGGVPVASLTKPTPVLIITGDGERVPATTVPIEDGRGPERTVIVRPRSGVPLSPPLPVVFDLPDFKLDGDTVRMRALDDLAGCAAILAAFERVVASRLETDVYAVFTRAEETGLYGARLMAEAGTLPPDTIVVSVESSAVIPGVSQGHGPVVRTGDASYTFDADAEQVLIAARESIRERAPGFRCQRALMSGGTCEATAFALYGYRTTGLALPLGNYHNATTSIPDPDGGVDAEYIRLSDYLAAVDLISEASASVAKRESSPTRRRLRHVPAEVRDRLRARL